MTSRLNALKEFIQANLYAVVAMTIIVVFAIGHLVFFVSAINPGLETRSRLLSQLDDGRQKLISVNGIQEESPASLQARLTAARATLTTSTNAFLTEAQVNQTIDALYQHARASGVTIIELQSQPALILLNPTPTSPKPTLILPTSSPTPLKPGSLQPSPIQPLPVSSPSVQIRTSTPQSKSPQPPLDQYYVTRIRLQVQGTTPQLLDFASRIEEASAKGFVINDINVKGNEGIATTTLIMDISLYVSQVPLAGAALSNQLSSSAVVPLLAATQIPASPAVTQIPVTFTPIPRAVTLPILSTATPMPSPTFAPRYTVYVVRPGDTLYSLSRRYGTTLEAIMAVNHLTGYNIRVSQQLLIPLP